MLHDPKSLSAKQAREFAIFCRLVPEAMTALLRAVVRTKDHREVIAATLAAHSPALASEVCQLIAVDEGSMALDRISDAVATLQEEDPNLFEAIPSREDMLRIAVRAIHGGSASDQQRSSLWASFCDRGEEHRLRDAYKFRHQIAARAEKTARTRGEKPPAETSPRSGRIDGGDAARARVASALDATQSEEVAADFEEGAVFATGEEHAAPIEEDADV